MTLIKKTIKLWRTLTKVVKPVLVEASHGTCAPFSRWSVDPTVFLPPCRWVSRLPQATRVPLSWQRSWRSPTPTLTKRWLPSPRTCRRADGGGREACTTARGQPWLCSLHGCTPLVALGGEGSRSQAQLSIRAALGGGRGAARGSPAAALVRGEGEKFLSGGGAPIVVLEPAGTSKTPWRWSSAVAAAAGRGAGGRRLPRCNNGGRSRRNRSWSSACNRPASAPLPSSSPSSSPSRSLSRSLDARRRSKYAVFSRAGAIYQVHDG